MDEDNKDIPRVTRARTRRLSTLDTDSRPSTPHLLDATVERASPRPVRRTRLNSATLDVRTPTRSTRLSVARGETPEPSTPASLSTVKRSTRTPAKSVRKQLALKEEDGLEESMDVVNEVAEVDSTRNTPTASLNQSPNSDERRVTRSMSKTPPAANRSTNNIPQSDITNSEEVKLKQPKQTETKEVIEDVDAQKQTADVQPEELIQLQHAEPTTKLGLNTPESSGKLQNVSSAKLQIKVKNIRMENSLAEVKTPNKFETQDVPNTSISNAEESSILVAPKVDDTKAIEEHKVDNAEKIEAVGDVSMEQPSSITDQNANVQDVFLDITVEEEQSFSKKKVLFPEINTAEYVAKPKYPKTPARINTQPVEIHNLVAESKNTCINSETPIKAILMKKRNSSTPLAKSGSPLGKNEADSNKLNVNAPPRQIDTIQPRSPLESVLVEEVVEKEKLSRLLLHEDASEEVSHGEDSGDEIENVDDEENGEQSNVSEFVDNEVEVVENYESGDSMDSSERREIEENEIPHDGESVGSQDTDDGCSEDESDEKLSFIVSDNEVDDDQDGIEALCFSSTSDHESFDSYGQSTKKRRRIIVHYSDDTDEESAQQDKKKNDSADESRNVSKLNLNRSTDKSDLNKTTSVDTTWDVKSIQDEVREDDVRSSSDEDETGVLEKSCHVNGISVCEVLNSSDEIKKGYGEDLVDESKIKRLPEENEEEDSPINSKITVAERNRSVIEVKTQFDGESRAPIEISPKHSIEDNDHPVPMEQDSIHEEKESIPKAVQSKVKSNNKSTEFHNMQNREDEAALLAGLSSCNLSHLQQMFNPLQKSRRQTLYVQGPQTGDSNERQPKLKRRSEQLNCDVQPSQSFIETLAEEKRQQSKRKRLSKSFCGAPDDLNTSAIRELQSKMNVKVLSLNATEVEVAQPIESDKEKEKVVSSSSSTSKTEELTMQNPMPKKISDPPSKDTDYYLQYCDEILQAANKAKLEQKKQQIASGKKPKISKNSVATITSVPVTTNLTDQTEQPNNAKKSVKRLQATRKAVKHAMHLLVPDPVIKGPQSLARKLSPQPDVRNKTTKVTKQLPSKKSKMNKASPTKSSDEENHHAIKRIKTSAGYVLMFKDVKDKIELIKTRSGIVKVEPCTPTPKYFKELPPSPHSRSGLQEVPDTPKGMKKKPEAVGRNSINRNPATESALRFKREMFKRNVK